MKQEIEKRIEKIKQLKKEDNIRMLSEVNTYAKKMTKLVEEFPNADYVTYRFFVKAKETVKLTSDLIRALKLSKAKNNEIIEKHIEKVRKIISNINFLQTYEPQMRIGFFKFF